MGLEIVLEDEKSGRLESIPDSSNVLHRVLPSPDDRSFRCLNQVDWYGDTVFNRQQMADVLQEVRGLERRTKDEEGRQLLRGLAELALDCQKTPHLYLKFYGD